MDYPQKVVQLKMNLTFSQLFFSLIESSFSVVEHISSVDEVERRDQFVNLSKTNVYSVNLCSLVESASCAPFHDIIINQALNFRKTEIDFMK